MADPNMMMQQQAAMHAAQPGEDQYQMMQHHQQLAAQQRYQQVLYQQHQLQQAHQLQYQQLHQQHRQQLQHFWQQQMQEIEQVSDFKNHQLPLARIKKIMKSDEEVRMISSEAPVVFAKACEMFILELTLRSWIHSEENKRRTLQRNDIAAAITKTDIFDFLVDIVPRDELKEEGIQVEAQAMMQRPPQMQMDPSQMNPQVMYQVPQQQQ
eukprot:gene13156-15535_t